MQIKFLLIEVTVYNSTGNDISFEQIVEEKKVAKVTRKFSDIQRHNRNLEINTDIDENGKEEVPSVQLVDEKFEEKEEVEEDFKNLKINKGYTKNIEGDFLKNGGQDTSNFRMATEDYDLSQSNIKTIERNQSIYKERVSELLISQPHILIDSQISQNPYGLSNMLSRSENEEIFVFPARMGSGNTDERMSNIAGKRPSFNDSIDMSFLKKDPQGQLSKYLPLDLPELDINHNSAREGLEGDEHLQNLNIQLQNENMHSNMSNQNIPSDLSDYSPKFLTGLNISK